MARRNDPRPSGRRDARGAASRGRQGGQQRGGSQQRGGKPRQQASGARTGAHTGVPARTRGPQGQRAGSKGDLIEGRRAAAEALELGLPITRALIQKDSGAVDPTLTDLARRLAANGVEVERVARPVLDSLSSHGAHQGIMLKVRPYRYASLHDIIEAAGSGNALVIVLDHVTDEGNFGAIVRTAEVVGAAGVVVAKSRAARVGVGAYKTSAGAVMHLPIAQVPNLASALDELKEHGFWAGGATEHARDLVWDAPVAGRLALVMGSEGSGISRLVRQHCDFEFKLPQRGQVESLNVAQATTAIAYEWLRRDMAAGEGAQAVSEPAGDGYDTPLDLPDTSDFDFPETDLG